MKALIQRVSRASVEVEGARIAEIASGILVLLGVERGDSEEEAKRMARKTRELRIFEDTDGKMNRSLVEERLDALVVSQFTLCAAIDSGRRPGFDGAAPPAQARALVSLFVMDLRNAGVRVAEGRFGVTMRVALVNEGPATFWIDSRKADPPLGD